MDVAASGPDDEFLLAAVTNGDTTAAAVLIRRYQRAVFGLALTVLGDPGTAEEAAQEAFVRMWRHAGSFDARRGRFSTWLLTITRNVALDARRVRGRSLPVDPSALAAWPVPTPSELGPGEAAERSSDAARVHQAVRALPEVLRRPLVMASWYGATAAEISAAEGIPLGTAKTRLRSALRRLRDELATEVQR